MATGNFFAGTFTRRPRVAAKVDDYGLTPISAGPTRTIAILGLATGGQPKVPQLFASPQDAAEVLRGGDLLTAIRRAFSPSTEFNGASLVYAVRVNPATVATLLLKDAAVANALLLTSVNWGLEENQIKVKVETGTSQGKKVTVAKGSETYVRDNLYRTAFSIQYTGAGSAATLSITGTTLTTAITGGPGSEQLNVDLATYSTLQKLVDFIAAQAAGVYTVAVTGPDPNALTLNGLDFVTTQAIKAAPFTVLAVLQAVIDWINAGQQPLVTAARSAGAGAPPANLPYTFLAGGAEGSTTNGDWQTCFDAIQSREVAFVVPVSSDASLHAMADVHCQLMSADGKRPRRSFVGAASGEYSSTLSTYITRAQNLNSDRTALAIQGVKGYDDATGLPITFPPYIMAAAWAGLQAGVPEIGDSITQKAVRATGLEWSPTIGETEIALAAGLLIVELAENRGFYRIVRGLSTWIKNDAYHRVEISVGIALDEVVRRVVDGLELFLGEKASPIILHRIASRTQSILISLQEQGIIVGDAAHPAYRDITVKLQGDTASVSFGCQPVLVVNFINVTLHAETFSGIVTIETP